jgi:hypothetical protein
MNINGTEEIIETANGLWLSALFSGISTYNPGTSFNAQRDAFFFLLQSLLERGQIKFVPPQELWREDRPVWDADSSEIVGYFRSRWPSQAWHEDDLILSDYFYEMPAVLWRQADGTYYGS